MITYSRQSAEKWVAVFGFREDEEERGAPVELTPEMVNAQFSLIDPSAVYADDKQKKEWAHFCSHSNIK